MKKQQKIAKKVITIASHIIDEQHYVSAIDILLGLGYLSPTILDDWQRGRLPNLEKGLQANPERLSFAMQYFHQWANEQCFIAREKTYVQKASSRTNLLIFSESGQGDIEKYYRTYYISPLLSDKKQQRLIETFEKAPEPVIYIVVKDSKCSNCQKNIPRGSFLMTDNNEAYCMKCSPYKDHVYLPSGDALLTRRAKKYSATFAIVVKFSSARKRYERQGILITEGALGQAEKMDN